MHKKMVKIRHRNTPYMIVVYYMNDIHVNIAHESATRCGKIQVIQELFAFQPVTPCFYEGHVEDE